MNYGKTAYLKILELEKGVLTNSVSETFNNKCFEISKPNIGETVSQNQNCNIEFPSISVSKDNTICFQIKTSLTTQNEGDCDFELIVDDCIIHQESKYISKGETDVLIIKTYTPIVDSVLNFSLKISTETELFFVTIKSNSAVIFGVDGEQELYEIELRALDLKNEKVLISFIDDEKIYFTKHSICEKSFKYEDFTFLLPAISHSFTLNTFAEKGEESNIVLYRVDPNKNLYMSKVFLGEPEQLIDSNVSCVHACTCPNMSDDTNLIAYIKNGKCYFRTIRNDIIISEKELDLPSGEYKDIRVVSKEDSEFLYIIASHSNGSNYILKSLVEIATGKIIEFLSTTYSIKLTKYIDLSLIKEKTKENIKTTFTYNIEPILFFTKTIDRLSKENLKLNCNLDVSDYKISSSIIYGIKLDKSLSDPTGWVSYTDDAEGFERAYMDFENDVFVDNGWKDRWPYNQIKPCVLKDGVILGYLNPNNYNQWEDGTPFDNTKHENGYIYVEFPKIHYSITRDDSYIYVKISNKQFEGSTCQAFAYKGKELDNLYISAYPGGNTSSMLSTNPDYKGFNVVCGEAIHPTAAMGYARNYDAVKKMSGERAEMLPYNVAIMLQCLYLIMFKSTDCQSVLGKGYAALIKTGYYFGGLNDKGMYYGKGEYGYSTKLFGLEDIYGFRATMCPGYYVDKNGIPRFIDPYDENMSYHPNNTGSYITTSKPFIRGYNGLRVATDINEDGNNIGFFHTTHQGERTKYFADMTAQYMVENGFTKLGFYGTSVTMASYNGIFCMQTVKGSTYSAHHNIRLVYYPLPKE